MIKIKVKTNKPRPQIIKHQDFYEVYVKARPEKGKANEEIIKLFWKKEKKKVRIVKGLTKRDKILEVIS